MPKKLLSLILALTLALSLAVPAFAVTPEDAQEDAMLLYNLGLFKGTGTTADGSPKFDLDRAPTRAEAVTILVRLLGAEEAATQKTIATPFTDVPAWAKPYVGYAYSKGYTNGVDAKHFGPNNTVSAAQFLTFLLRALGYKDGTDFTWDSPWTLTDQLGISNGAYNAKTKTFLRADAAALSASTLYAKKKGSDKTLLKDLLDNGAISGSTVVIWDYDAVAFQKDYASFLFYPVSDKTARITGVQTGEYHIGLGVPSNMLEVLKKDPKLKVETVDLGIMPCAMFNCKKGRATDVNLRNAILACLDMNELMLAAQGDKSLYYLNPGLMPKSSRWWTSESLGKYNKPDLKKAAEYLKASSYDGKPLVFITTKANDYFYKTALLIQQMVKPAGIKIDLQVYDNPTLQQYRTQHDKYDIFSAGLTAKLDPTLISIMDDTWCGAYASPKKSKYAAILQNEGDFKVRYKAWKDLTKVFYEELPFITYGERRVAIVARSNVHGMFTTTTKYYWNTWLDQK